MRIKDISVHLVNAVWRNFIIVKVTSDDGIIGYGEGTLADFERTIEAAIYDYKPFLIGKEINIPEITFFLYRHFYWRGGPMLMSAISAISRLSGTFWESLPTNRCTPCSVEKQTIAFACTPTVSSQEVRAPRILEQPQKKSQSRGLTRSSSIPLGPRGRESAKKR